jgi:hypothetical protein
MAFFVVLLQGCGVVSHPMYEGQVLDLETQEPIEGAAVVAIYMTDVLTPVDTLSNTIKVREVVTDSEGRFKLPSCTTIVMPLSVKDDTTFVIYKPGYLVVNRVRIGDCFSGKDICETGNVPWRSDRKDIFYRLSPGKVELPRLHKRDDRIRVSPSLYEREQEHAPHMMQLTRDEDKALMISSSTKVEHHPRPEGYDGDDDKIFPSEKK